MKVGILTWSKETNHGAVLQTYATYMTVAAMGHDPIVLDYISEDVDNNMDNAFRKRIIRIAKRMRPDKLIVRSRLPNWQAEKKTKFESFRNSILSFGALYSAEANLDRVLIGSDMVFDFYEGYNPFMYGKNVNCEYIFSYAACFGYTTEELIKTYINRDEIIHYIRRLKGVSYRDDNTGKILKNVCGINNAVKTIDPVLLYGFNRERTEWNRNGWENRKYILVYAYTYNMDSLIEINEIKKYARKKGLDIISVGYIHLWCDEVINADPREFVELFNNASVIVTDTFHGTVFSLAFEKQFITIVRNNAFKIVDIMNEVGLDDRLHGSIKKKIKMLEDRPLDYSIINQRIGDLRETSTEYLRHHIKSEVIS